VRDFFKFNTDAGKIMNNFHPFRSAAVVQGSLDAGWSPGAILGAAYAAAAFSLMLLLHGAGVSDAVPLFRVF